jgi:hypothetical protein
MIEDEIDIEDENLDEEIIDIGEDFFGLDAWGKDPVWEIPIIRRVPNPKYRAGSKEKPVLSYRYWVPVKLLTQTELMRMQEGKKIPKGSRSIIDDTMIRKYSKTQAEMLNLAIQRAGGKIKITMDLRGTANYSAGELSIHDLSREDISRLEVAISPGVSKSAEAFEDDVRSSRRSPGEAPPESKRLRVSRSNPKPDE